MAEFHRGTPRRGEDDRGSLLRHGAHGNAVRSVRRPSRPCLPRRSPRGRRDAVLHERLCSRPRETGGLTAPTWTTALYRVRPVSAGDTCIVECARQHLESLASGIEGIVSEAALHHETDLDNDVAVVGLDN